MARACAAMPRSTIEHWRRTSMRLCATDSSSTSSSKSTLRSTAYLVVRCHRLPNSPAPALLHPCRTADVRCQVSGSGSRIFESLGLATHAAGRTVTLYEARTDPRIVRPTTLTRNRLPCWGACPRSSHEPRTESDDRTPCVTDAFIDGMVATHALGNVSPSSSRKKSVERYGARSNSVKLCIWGEQLDAPRRQRRHHYQPFDGRA